eukprot:NP_495214.1 Uncharacterized protein CELE_H12I13.3 [Caenorhabditis elegans]
MSRDELRYAVRRLNIISYQQMRTMKKQQLLDLMREHSNNLYNIFPFENGAYNYIERPQVIREQKLGEIFPFQEAIFADYREFHNTVRNTTYNNERGSNIEKFFDKMRNRVINDKKETNVKVGFNVEIEMIKPGTNETINFFIQLENSRLLQEEDRDDFYTEKCRKIEDRIHRQELNGSGILMRGAVNDIPKVEKLNNLAINVFSNDTNSIIPVHISKKSTSVSENRIIDLFLIKNEDRMHYCLVKNINYLIGNESSNHSGLNSVCRYCFNSFRSKTKYDNHLEIMLNLIKALIQALNHGLKLKKIHRILTFKESAWMKKYIMLNTNLRKQAKNDFEKDFFKLMNNSVFGKTMENIRNRVNIRLVTDDDSALKLIRKPNFKNSTIITEDLLSVELTKTKLVFDKPIYFHYDVMQKHYGDKIKLCYQDTDSLIYEVETEDIYEDMGNMKEWFDFSDYPKNHPLYDESNKKVIGKFKDELNGKNMDEGVFLKPKQYDFNVEGAEKKKSKGVKKNVTKTLTLDDFKRCLFQNEVIRKTQYMIRAKSHQFSKIK